jgi:hypothetical protein
MPDKYPTEDAEQIAVMEWAELQSGKFPQLKLLFHIPNGGSRHPAEAKKLKAMGVKPGVPDLFLPVPGRKCYGLFIEMKRVKGGTLSENQKEWISALNLQVYIAVVCHGADEAIAVIKSYLG